MINILRTSNVNAIKRFNAALTRATPGKRTPFFASVILLSTAVKIRLSIKMQNATNAILESTAVLAQLGKITKTVLVPYSNQIATNLA